MKKIRIHPLTLLVFLLAFILKKNVYFVLYFFIFLHELSHLITARISGYRAFSIHLYPWGCMLSLSTLPDKRKRIIILLAGPLCNIILSLMNIYPKENLSLALFNLIPVMPLDGGSLLNTLFPNHSFLISLLFIASLAIFSLYQGNFPLLSILLAVVLIIGEKNKLKKNIDLKVMGYFNQK